MPYTIAGVRCTRSCRPSWWPAVELDANFHSSARRSERPRQISVWPTRRMRQALAVAAPALGVPAVSATMIPMKAWVPEVCCPRASFGWGMASS